jgi:hypothetical protein
MASNATSVTPSSYEELFELYWDYTVQLVQKFGINATNAEDAASTILVKFIDRDFLAKYDPEHQTAIDGNGKKKRTTFQGFLSGFISLYVRQEKDKQWTKARKEPRSTNQPVGEDNTPWIEVYGPTSAGIDDYTSVNLDLAVAEAQTKLDQLPIRGQRDLALVFRAVVKQIREDGKVDRKAIAAMLNVSPTAVCLTFSDLREALKQIGFAPGLI